MKKILLLLGITTLSLNNAAFGYDIYNVPETQPYTYQFNVYAPGEDKECTREYPFSQNELTSIFQAGIFWQEILNLAPIKPAIYFLKPEKDYNAYASSNLVTIAESPYKVSQVNAVLNNRTITSPKSEINPEYDGIISIGVGLKKEMERQILRLYTGYDYKWRQKRCFNNCGSELESRKIINGYMKHLVNGIYMPFVFFKKQNKEKIKVD